MKPIARFLLCCLIFALVWLGTGVWWTFFYGILLFLFIEVVHLVSALALGVAVGRCRSLVLDICFVVFVTVLMFFFTDFSQRALHSLLTGKPRLPFAFSPVSLGIGFFGSLAGVVIGHVGIFAKEKSPQDTDKEE